MTARGQAAPLLALLCVLGTLYVVLAAHSPAHSTLSSLNSELLQPSSSQDMEETPSVEETQVSPTPTPSLTSQSESIGEPFISSLSFDVTPTRLSVDVSSASVTVKGTVTTSEPPRLTTTATVAYPSPPPGSSFCHGEEMYGIRWPAWVVRMTVNVSCPGGGTASRYCTPTAVWDDPDLFDCLTPHFVNLQNVLRSGSASSTIATVTSLAENALNVSLCNITGGPERLTAKNVKVLLDSLSFIAEWSTNQSSNISIQADLVKAINNSLTALDHILLPSLESFWTRVTESPDSDVSGLPIQLLQTVEALALQLATVELDGGQGGEERVLVLQQMGLSYGLYDFLSNQTLRRPSERLFRNDSFLQLTGHTPQPQANIPAQFVYDRLHGTTVTRPLPYVYLVLKGVSQLLPCDGCESANLIGPPDSHVISLQLGVQCSCPRKSQVRLEGFHLDDSSYFHNTVTVLDEPQCVFYNYTARSWSKYAVKTRYDRSRRVVTCLTHHLTSFAVMKKSREYKTLGDFILFIYLGSGVLVFVAVFGISTLLCTCLGCQLCKKVNNLIHLNLAVSMAAGGLALIFGVNPIPSIQSVYYGYDISPGTVCRVSAAVIHFCALSSFTWLMCEAILLLAMVSKLQSKCIGCGCFLFIFSWLLPAAPVVVAVLLLEPLTALNSGVLICWPTMEWTTELAFWVPIVVFSIVSVIMAAAAAFLLCTQRKGIKMTEGNTKMKKKFSQLRIMTVGVFVLLVSMLCAWTLADLMFQYSAAVAVAALFVIVTPVQAFVLVVMFICQNKFCRGGDGCQSPWNTCCQSTRSKNNNRQRNLWAEEGERAAKLNEVARANTGNGLGESVAATAELKRNPSGVSTTSVTFCKRPVYIATPAANQETGSNSGESITGTDVELVSYTPLTPVDSGSLRSGANDRVGLLPMNSREAETTFTNTGMADVPPRADRSGTETSV